MYGGIFIMGRPSKKPFKINSDGKIVISGNLKELPKDCCYDNIPNLKKPGVLIEYEPWQLEEIAKCAIDIEYFCTKYVYINDADLGKTLFTIRPYQKRMLQAYVNNRFSVTMCPRQGGKSMVAGVFILHHMLFNADKTSAIIANKASIAKEIFAKVKMAYNELPYWLQMGVMEWHKSSMLLENGSHCFASATSADGIRGVMVNGILFLDEFAIIRRNIAEAFFESVYPTISASTEAKIIIASTPMGMNHFHVLWRKAINSKNDFIATEVFWNEIPGRDEDFKKNTIKNIGIKKWNQEFECKFIGSSSTLIKARILENLDAEEPIQVAKDGKLKIWKFPLVKKMEEEKVITEGNQYVCGVDTAKGTGNDYSVVQVLDITTFPFKQVAKYRSNEINTRAFGEIVVEIATKYNNAYIMVENNDIGQAVVDYIWHEAEYENLVNYSPMKKRDIGIRSTKNTKSLANDLLQLFMEDGKIEIIDSDTIYEMSKYVESQTFPGKFSAEEGENDDCVTSLLWGLFILKTNYIDNEDIKDEKIDSLQEHMDENDPNYSQPLDAEPVDLFIK